MNHRSNRSKLLLVFFVLLGFILSYRISEVSINDGDLLVGYANSDVQECGCSKCHSIELNGCSGCHNSQQDNGKSSQPTKSPRESNEPDSADPNDNIGSQESKIEKPDSPGSNNVVSNSEPAPKKSKQKEPANNSQK